jgi:hypothetical protein
LDTAFAKWQSAPTGSRKRSSRIESENDRQPLLRERPELSGLADRCGRCLESSSPGLADACGESTSPSSSAFSSKTTFPFVDRLGLTDSESSSRFRREARGCATEQGLPPGPSSSELLGGITWTKTRENRKSERKSAPSSSSSQPPADQDMTGGLIALADEAAPER